MPTTNEVQRSHRQSSLAVSKILKHKLSIAQIITAAQLKLMMLRIFRLAMRYSNKIDPQLDKNIHRQTRFVPPPEKISFSEEEERILQYWQTIDAFKQQLRKTSDLPPYTFYDGPPFATGTPHYGHIAAGTIKDVVCRYASQTGHHVQRRFGWDCHGLPVQYEIDKQLKITNKKQVIEMGIEKYNQACRNIVMRYSAQWEHVVSRFGRWVDFKNEYKTMDLDFMESVWAVFKVIFDKGLVYRGRRIMPYSNACNTVLSNFQVQQNYKEVDDPSIYITFPLKSNPSVKFLAWTTTPWTLPSNLALAVNPDLNYVKVLDPKRSEVLIMGQSKLKDYFGKQKYEVLQKMKGKQLQGMQYIPLYDYFNERAKDGCFTVQIAAFVTDTDGTGIVHCAPGFGQDDYKMCVEKKLIKPDDPPVPVDDNGRFTKEVSQFQGIYIKTADQLIMKDLKERGRLLKKGVLKHNYPFCWRSQTPLIYKAVSTWFIKVTEIKQDLVKNNHKAYWVPKAIQQKKFDNWLKDAKDWCFSRNRFWGNPIPLWVSEDGEEIICVGSIKQLQQLTGAKIIDLHREHIDMLTIQSRQGKGKLHRIQQVFDCWFESGSMPFAQVHYPFTTSEQQFSKIFPADFIGEGIDQTRGWFYTLNVIATAVKNSNPYKNLIVNGLVLTEDGKKMSKRLKNYPDPMQVCNEFGADAVRLYLVNSPLVRADNLNFSKEGVRGVVKEVFLPWYNAYRFLIQNISVYEQQAFSAFYFEESLQKLEKQFKLTDKWILSSLNILIKDVRRQMGQYKLYNVANPLIKFLEHLTNWYLRLNRARLKGQNGIQQSFISLNVLLHVLLNINVLMAPFVPFFTEYMYQNIKLVINQNSQLRQQSIHHLFIPEVNQRFLDQQLRNRMDQAMTIVETARKLRENKQISIKNPIYSLKILTENKHFTEQIAPFLNYIQRQINVQQIKIQAEIEKYVRLQALPNFAVIGPKFKGNKTFSQIKEGITKLNPTEIKALKVQGHIMLSNHRIELTDVLIQQKFVTENIKQYEAIGGDSIIVLLDVRQSEELKLKGVARELISRIQKLKKKAGVTAKDHFTIYYKLQTNEGVIRKALAQQRQSITVAVKKQFLQWNNKQSVKKLSEQIGKIEQQAFELYLCVDQGLPC